MKRFVRMSIRSLLVAVACVAIGLACLTHYSNTRKSAFSAIRDSGGNVHMWITEPTILEKWFGSEVFGTVMKVDMRKGNIDNELLAHIGKLSELGQLDLSYGQIDDDDLQLISHLPLSELWLQSTQITDESAKTLSMMPTLGFLQLNATSLSDTFLKNLEPLPKLYDLGLRGTKVTGDGMRYLSRHPSLSELDVYNTSVDDEGVFLLTECDEIEKLGLSRTRVTDAVFEHLHGFPKLIKADLSGNRSVTTDAVKKFESEHPKCDIEWYRD